MNKLVPVLFWRCPEAVDGEDSRVMAHDIVAAGTGKDLVGGRCSDDACDDESDEGDSGELHDECC